VDVGVLQRFERRLEGMVSGAFAKAFKADVQPVEIASALQRELDDRAAIVGKGATLVPNKFVVELSAHDFERLAMYQETLGTELAEVVRDHANEQHYQLRGDVDVSFIEVPDLDIGVHRIKSTVVASVTAVAPPEPAAPPKAEPPRPRRASHARAETELIQQPPAPATPEPAETPPPFLEVNGDRHPLTRPVTILGRGTQVDLRIDDAGVSRRHAEIHLGPPAMLVDLDSTNGTFLDGSAVGKVELFDGACIGIGDTVLVYRQPAE
jgi:pSer/pThr/pTyr-binding forkhead associated (FHA) protein